MFCSSAGSFPKFEKIALINIKVILMENEVELDFRLLQVYQCIRQLMSSKTLQYRNVKAALR